MSHQPSPGPSQPAQIHPGQHVFQPISTPATRHKSRAYQTGIAANADDVKYQAKYKELKRKVRDLEGSNDSLYYKILDARRSIQRMKVERAILYERLQNLPPSPPSDTVNLPAVQGYPGVEVPSSHAQSGAHQHAPQHRDYMQVREPRERGFMEFGRSPDAPPHMMAHDRSASMDIPPGGHGQFSRDMAATASSSRRSGRAHDSSRQLPPLVPHHSPEGLMHQESISAHGRPPMLSPRGQEHLSAPPSHSHSRSHSSSSRTRHQQQGAYPPASGHGYPPQHSPESYHAQPVHPQHAQPSSSERAHHRRREMTEMTIEQYHDDRDPAAHSHRQSSHAPHSPSHERRPASRMHDNHRPPPSDMRSYSEVDQDRMHWERERERAHGRDREMEREHVTSPPHSMQQPRQQSSRHSDYQQYSASSRGRDDQHPQYNEGHASASGYSRHSRPDSPGSGSDMQ